MRYYVVLALLCTGGVLVRNCEVCVLYCTDGVFSFSESMCSLCVVTCSSTGGVLVRDSDVFVS